MLNNYLLVVNKCYSKLVLNIYEINMNNNKLSVELLLLINRKKYCPLIKKDVFLLTISEALHSNDSILHCM